MKVSTGLLAGVFMVSAIAAAPAKAEVSELKITKQPSVIYLPAVIMEHDHLIEKYAKKMGLGNLKVQWVTFSSGGAATDALMSGQIQMVTSGTSNMLLLWDRTHGQVKGVSGVASVPMVLVTRNPKVKSLGDFTDADKIAVPTVKVSMQATILQMAAAQKYGFNNRNKFDNLTVSLGHPDASIAVLSGKGGIDSHFSAPPYMQRELAGPGIHKVISSFEVVGPVSNAMTFSTKQFHDANPKTIRAFLAALNEAEALIKKDKRLAAEKYLETTHEKYSVDQIVKIISDPHNMYSATPYGTMKFADYMYRSGTLKHKPASWKDVYYPEVHNLPGN